VVRDRVDELRPQPLAQAPVELVDLQPVLVDRHGHDLGLEAAECHDRAEVGRRLDDHRVAAVEERLAHQLERLHAAARHEQLVVARPPSLHGLEPLRERVERAGEAARRSVLERARLARGRELGQKRRGAVAREGARIREPARERDHVRLAEEAEHGGDPLSHVAAGARGEEAIPARRLAHGGHATDYTRAVEEAYALDVYARTPKHLVLILAREFASNLATPMMITDAGGTLVYFNEAAEAIVGRSFAEAGEMPFADWSERFAARTQASDPFPPDRRPVWIALTERRATHERLVVTALDGRPREIEVTAFPLFAHADEFVGVVGIFWRA
jgi:PAS domain-containing protein